MNKEISKMKRDLATLQDSHDRRQDWLRMAKRRAGFDISTSFDIIFKALLESHDRWNLLLKKINETGNQEFLNIIKKVIKETENGIS
jgi:hypothetical protein